MRLHAVTGLPLAVNEGLITDEALADEARDLVSGYRNIGQVLDEATAREMVLAPLRRADRERRLRQRAADFARQRVDALPMRKPVPVRRLIGDLPHGLPAGYLAEALSALIADRTLVADGNGDGRTLERVRT